MTAGPNTPSIQRIDPNTFPGAVIDNARPPNARALITSTAALTAIGAGPAEFSEPHDNSTRWVFQTRRARQIGLEFFGTGADNATWTANVRGFRRYDWDGPRGGIHNQEPFPNLWRPRPLLQLSGALGSYIVDPDSAEARDPLTATGSIIRGSDAITISADYTFQQSAEVDHEDGTINNWATVVLDPMGCEFIAVEVRNGTSTGLIGFALRL